MFQYSSTALNYGIYSGTTFRNWITPTLGTSGTDIIQGQWFHAVAIRSGNNLSSYINGQLKGTAVIDTSGGASVVSNPSNEGYSWHTNANVAAARMYRRALTAAEIQQNYIATKSRFGL
jgi:hypothetical protein